MNPGAANNGRIGCGRERVLIDVVAVPRRRKAGRNVVEKKLSIISTSLNAGSVNEDTESKS